MAWKPLSFTDGEILYADSHMNPLQDNFGAMAAQEAGAPMIDVSCSNINLLTSSAFIGNVASIDTLHISSGTLTADLLSNDIENSSSFTTYAGSANLFNIDSGSLNSIAVNSDMEYIGQPFFACRAWVNFDGTGTPSIRASGNVTSITDHGPGDYSVNFTTAMPDTNYAVALTSKELDAATFSVLVTVPAGLLISNTYATTFFRLNAATLAAAVKDPKVVNVMIFR